MPRTDTDDVSAIALSTLRFNAEGLLQASWRFPVDEADVFTAAGRNRAAYRIEQELIDCETGYALTTTVSLFDQHHRLIISRAGTRDLWKRQLRDRSTANPLARWPIADLVLLPCALLAHPLGGALRRAHATGNYAATGQAARTRQREEIEQMLTAAARPLRFDPAQLAAYKSATPEALLQVMTDSHAQWRKSFHRAVQERHARLLATTHMAAINAGAQDYDSTLAHVRADIFDVQYRGRDELARGAPMFPMLAVRSLARIDCATGLWVPRGRNWLDSGGTVVRTEHFTGAKALAELQIALRVDDASWAQFRQPMQVPEQLRMACADVLAGRARRYRNHEGGEDMLAPGVTEATMDRPATPVSLLLAIRTDIRTRMP